MTYHRPALAPWGRARGRGGALGDVVGPGMDLADQVNRFGPAAPEAYQFVSTPFPRSPTVSLGLATAALTIYQRRAADAYAHFHDQGSLQAIEKANTGFADPVAFVTNNVAEVTTVLHAFADSLGLPAAGDAAPDSGGLSTGTLLLAALVVWWLL